MKLAGVIHETCMEIGASAPDKEAVLRRAAELATRHPALDERMVETIYAGLKEREALGSTGFGNGIAIPHCRLPEVTEFIVGLITIPDGVAFDAADGEPVRIVVFMIAPAEQSSLHIRLLSEISQVFRTPGAVEEVLQSRTPADARATLLAYGHDELRGRSEERKLLQIIVQKEAVFQDILEAVVGVDPRSIAVIEARTAEEHLAHMPLFSGLWDGRRPETCRVIVALIEKPLINETIRRVEHVTGRLDEHTGVAIVVHDPFYVAGRLTE